MHLGALVVLVAVATTELPAGDPRLDQARELFRHDLLPQASELFIGVLYGPKSSDTDNAECLYQLGEISFEQNRTAVALEDWNRLVAMFPTSTRAAEVKDRLVQMGELVSKEVEKSSHQAMADVYLGNGDFWSPSDRIYHLDTSYLDDGAMAGQWYDRAIKEFPGTKAAAMAYERKVLIAAGGYNDHAGKLVCGDPQKAAKIFTEMVKDTPQATSLQRLRFVVGQAFWYHGDIASARAWFEQLTQVGAKADDFYVELARNRLATLARGGAGAGSVGTAGGVASFSICK